MGVKKKTRTCRKRRGDWAKGGIPHEVKLKEGLGTPWKKGRSDT